MQWKTLYASLAHCTYCAYCILCIIIWAVFVCVALRIRLTFWRTTNTNCPLICLYIQSIVQMLVRTPSYRMYVFMCLCACSRKLVHRPLDCVCIYYISYSFCRGHLPYLPNACVYVSPIDIHTACNACTSLDGWCYRKWVCNIKYIMLLLCVSGVIATSMAGQHNLHIKTISQLAVRLPRIKIYTFEEQLATIQYGAAKII